MIFAEAEKKKKLGLVKGAKQGMIRRVNKGNEPMDATTNSMWGISIGITAPTLK